MNPLPFLLLLQLWIAGGGAPRGEQPPSPRIAGSICVREELLFELPDPSVDPPSRSHPPFLLQDPKGVYWALLIERVPASRQRQMKERSPLSARSIRGDIRSARALPSLKSAQSHEIELLGDLEACIHSAEPTWVGDQLAAGWTCRSPRIAGSDLNSDLRSFITQTSVGQRTSTSLLCDREEPSCTLHALVATSAGKLWAIGSNHENQLWAEFLSSSAELTEAKKREESRETQKEPTNRRFSLGQTVPSTVMYDQMKAVAIDDQVLVAHWVPDSQGKTTIQLHRVSTKGPVGEPIPVSYEGRADPRWIDLAVNASDRAAVAWIRLHNLTGEAPEARLRVISLTNPEASADEIRLFGDQVDPPKVHAIYLTALGNSFLVGWIDQETRKTARLWIQLLDPQRGLVGEPWLISDEIQPGANGSYRSPRSQSLWLFNGEVLWRTWSRTKNGVNEIRRCTLDIESLRTHEAQSDTPAPKTRSGEDSVTSNGQRYREPSKARREDDKTLHQRVRLSRAVA